MKFPKIYRSLIMTLVIFLFHSSMLKGEQSSKQLSLHGRPLFHAIFALDTNQVWVGGIIYDADNIYSHTLMYMTNDGGKTWQKRGPRINNSTIFSLYFLDQNTGWALGAWTTESTGAPFVLKTEDGGLTWENNPIPIRSGRPSPLFVPVSIEFITHQVGMVQVEGCIVEDELAIFITQDGGASWHFSHGRHVGCRGGNHLSITSDHVLWKLQNNLVYKSDDNGINWQSSPTQPVESAEKLIFIKEE